MNKPKMISKAANVPLAGPSFRSLGVVTYSYLANETKKDRVNLFPLLLYELIPINEVLVPRQ